MTLDRKKLTTFPITAAVLRESQELEAKIADYKRRALANQLVADRAAEIKTEGRTPRPFRTNPHDA